MSPGDTGLAKWQVTPAHRAWHTLGNKQSSSLLWLLFLSSLTSQLMSYLLLRMAVVVSLFMVFVALGHLCLFGQREKGVLCLCQVVGRVQYHTNVVRA